MLDIHLRFGYRITLNIISCIDIGALKCIFIRPACFISYSFLPKIRCFITLFVNKVSSGINESLKISSEIKFMEIDYNLSRCKSSDWRRNISENRQNWRLTMFLLFLHFHDIKLFSKLFNIFIIFILFSSFTVVRHSFYSKLLLVNDK